MQGSPRIKTRSNPKQTDMLLTVRGLFHIIIPMKSLLVEFDFALSSSGNLNMLSQQAPTCAGSWNFLCSPPLSGNFCCGLHFGDMRAGDTCACLAPREGKSRVLPPCTKWSDLFWSRLWKKTKDFLKTVNNKGVGINKTAAWGTLTETFRLGQFLVGKSITLI